MNEGNLQKLASLIDSPVAYLVSSFDIIYSNSQSQQAEARLFDKVH